MENFRTLVPLLLLLGVNSSPITAQWPAEIAAGARVQVRLPEAQYQTDPRRGHLIRGRVRALTRDTLYVAVTDSLGPLAVPRTVIQHIDLSRGVPSRGASALRRGILSGVFSALTLVLFNKIDNRSDTGEAALVGGGVGFAFGAVLGALYPRERWKSVRFAPP
jgi:hypothetical protein